MWKISVLTDCNHLWALVTPGEKEDVTFPVMFFWGLVMIAIWEIAELKWSGLCMESAQLMQYHFSSFFGKKKSLFVWKAQRTEIFCLLIHPPVLPSAGPGYHEVRKQGLTPVSSLTAWATPAAVWMGRCCRTCIWIAVWNASGSLTCYTATLAPFFLLHGTFFFFFLLNKLFI